jgi:hypothetical protein
MFFGSNKGRCEMEKRIIRLEKDLWHIRTDVGKLPNSEQKELIMYFEEVRLPYRLKDGCLCIVGEVDRDSVFEQLNHFYDGRAGVYPF